MAQPVQQYTPAPVVFTQAAADKVHALMLEENNLDLNLRVFITGGGCSGFQYGFTFDETTKPDDSVVEKTVAEPKQAIVRLLIDPLSLAYLTNAEIDYEEDLTGSRFIIRNPNASTTCGCGSSFSV